MKRKIVLVIAGSDSGGGAGIQADLKSVSSQGAHAVTVITAITAQNTISVRRADPLPLDLIESQFDAVFEDFEFDAVKTGMLANSDVVRLVASQLKEHGVRNLVVDPVMISKHGRPLLEDEAVKSVQELLLPLADVVTPNLHEAQRLCGFSIRSLDEMEAAGRSILSLGPKAVVVKGGHREEEPMAIDVLVTRDEVLRLEEERIPTRNTHGTGCTFASALAARLARGDSMIEAVTRTKAFITDAIRHSLSIGRGLGPVDSLFSIEGATDD
jgi:hydroxymethylpyrimidine/phosphomethylpyrimidine kinase